MRPLTNATSTAICQKLTEDLTYGLTYAEMDHWRTSHTPQNHCTRTELHKCGNKWTIHDNIHH